VLLEKLLNPCEICATRLGGHLETLSESVAIDIVLSYDVDFSLGTRYEIAQQFRGCDRAGWSGEHGL
jgi:hypothetical protein